MLAMRFSQYAHPNLPVFIQPNKNKFVISVIRPYLQ